MIKLESGTSVVTLLKTYEVQKSLDDLKEETKVFPEILESIKDLNLLELDSYSKALLTFDFEPVIRTMSTVVTPEKLKPVNLDIFTWFSNPDMETILKSQAIKVLCESKIYFEKNPDKVQYFDCNGWMVIKLKDQICLTYFLGTAISE